MIKWILFDQAGVQTNMAFEKKKTYKINGKIFFAKDLESIFYIPEYNKFMVGQINEKQLVSAFLKRTKLLLSYTEYMELFNKDIKPIRGMEEIISKLYDKYKLVTIINEGSEWANYKLDITGFRKYFKKNFISGDLGLAKPQPKIYLYVLNKLNAKPEECIFIDDKEENCIAAIKLGITSIVFKNTNQLKKELQKQNINII
jgi:HAD superfamily hydrolase (TIGR01509 family)